MRIERLRGIKDGIDRRIGFTKFWDNMMVPSPMFAKMNTEVLKFLQVREGMLLRGEGDHFYIFCYPN